MLDKILAKGKHFCLLWLICSSSGSSHGSGRQSPQGSSREGCCGTKKEWIPRRAREAATADWQNPVLAQLSDGKCQQSTSGREGRPFPSHSFLWDCPLPRHILQQEVMLMCCSLQSMWQNVLWLYDIGKMDLEWTFWHLLYNFEILEAASNSSSE